MTHFKLIHAADTKLTEELLADGWVKYGDMQGGPVVFTQMFTKEKL